MEDLTACFQLIDTTTELINLLRLTAEIKSCMENVINTGP